MRFAFVLLFLEGAIFFILNSCITCGILILQTCFLFEGTGYGQVIGVICVGTYYCSLMALTLFYLVNSFTSNLPWSDCWSDWNQNSIMDNKECIASSNKGAIGLNNTISSSELYFRYAYQL